MTDNERREALLAALDAWPGSDRALAEAAGLSHTTLGRIRSGDMAVSQTTAAAVAGAMYGHAAALTEAADKLTEDLKRTAVAAEELPSGHERFREVAEKLKADQGRFHRAVLATGAPFQQMMDDWKAQSERLQQLGEQLRTSLPMPQFDEFKKIGEQIAVDQERFQKMLDQLGKLGG